jgi:hypothetical protein
MIELIGKLFTEGLIYVLLYLWLFSVAVLESCKEFTRYKLLFSFSTCFLLFLFTGLRWETGTDWIPYKTLFDTIELNWSFLINVYAFDFGYVLLNAFVRLFSSSYVVFLLIDSFIALGLISWFLAKHSPFPNLSLFVFYNAYFVSQFMGSNRRMIALGAVLFAFYFVFSRKRGKYISWQSIGFLFHRTSFMVAVSWLIPLKRFSSFQLCFLLIGALIIGIPQIPFKVLGLLGEGLSFFISTSNPLIEKLLFYSNSEHNLEAVSENVNPAVLMTLSVIKRSIFLAYYLYVVRLNKGVLDPLTDYFFNLYIIGFTIYMLLNGSPIFQMISTYFTFIEIALIGRFWIYTNKNLKMVFLCVLFIYGFFQLLSALTAYPELYMPYKTFFN